MCTLLTSKFCLVYNMQTLWLSRNQIGDVGVEALSTACAGGALAHLRNLYIGGNSISDKTKDTMRTVISKSGGSVHL